MHVYIICLCMHVCLYLRTHSILYVEILLCSICLALNVFVCMHFTSKLYILCPVLGDITNITNDDFLYNSLLQLSRLLNGGQYQGKDVAFELPGAFATLKGYITSKRLVLATFYDTVCNPYLPKEGGNH